MARLALRQKAVGVAEVNGSEKAPSLMHQETNNGTGWIIRLDTRPATASVSIESTSLRNYVEGLVDEFARVGMLLRLLAEGAALSMHMPCD